MRSYILTIIFLLFCTVLWASNGLEKKKVEAKRILSKIEIDGVMDEMDWSIAKVADGFKTLEPTPGATPVSKTEVRLLYDDEAIYVGAMMYDNAPDSILREMTLRDDVGNTDFFSISFDFYRDGINGVGFLVTASGVQFDAKYSSNGEDTNWDAVWLSKAKIVDNGWVVEMKIPYSALRFSEAEEQIWHVNFERSNRRHREKSWWQEIDPELDTWFGQYGLTEGITDIVPPARLFLFPYVSYYLEHFPENEEGASNWSRSINGGMDLKYGLNDAYTLDMTLVPDFGQVVSDNQVLNLGPFEQIFDENRQFFTEGTELFGKADVFYSRRIGGIPMLYGDVEDGLLSNEEVSDNPSVSQLINATKISGRGEKGLGVGVFNAITSETSASIRNIENGSEREMITNPLINYNVLVFDQNLWTNAYVSLINTNVMRNGSFYDANVTGTEFRLPNKANSWAIEGEGVVSQLLYSDSTTVGSSFETSIEKISGHSTFGVGVGRVGKNYNINDLGVNFRTNFTEFGAKYNYRTFEPVGKFNKLNAGAWMEYSVNNEPKKFANFSSGWNVFALTNGWTAFGLNGNFEPVVTFDFFEPRVEGRFYEYPKNWRVGGFVSSDYRKTFAGDFEWGTRHWDEDGRYNYYFELRPRVRLSDQFFVEAAYFNFKLFNNVGWAEEWNDEIVFGIRDRVEQGTTLRARYIFSPLMGISFRGRHYWSRVEYDSFHALDENGRLTPSDYTGLDVDGTSLENDNFNAFTIDTQFTWRFSPGSEMSFVWKNQIYTSDPELRTAYFDNLDSVLKSDQLNSFSIKVLYFLDYNTLKKKS